jgi:hypothetical protein
MIKIWLGIRSWETISAKQTALPKNLSLANAKAAVELKTAAKRTRKTTRTAVLKYSLENGTWLKTELKFVNRHPEGKIAGGVRMVSETVLKLVNTIHTKGNTIRTDPAISMMYTNVFDMFFWKIRLLFILRVIGNPLFLTDKLGNSYHTDQKHRPDGKGRPVTAVTHDKGFPVKKVHEGLYVEQYGI